MNALVAAVPADVWRAVFDHLTPYDVMHLRCVCVRLWRLTVILPEFVCRWFPMRAVLRYDDLGKRTHTECTHHHRVAGRQTFRLCARTSHSRTRLIHAGWRNQRPMTDLPNGTTHAYPLMHNKHLHSPSHSRTPGQSGYFTYVLIYRHTHQ